MSKIDTLHERLARLPHDCFRGAKTGVEKESLRISRDGHISQLPHPEDLGAPLTHACITTDFSEALLELITPPCTNSHEVLAFMADTEAFVHQQLADEYLWSASMPCLLRGENDIPIAHYGDSRPGKMKTTYRRGLARRYGKSMQVIAGVHFNYSFQECIWDVLREHETSQLPAASYMNQKYMATIRNIQRYGWLNLYLFGASPAICNSFNNSKSCQLEQFDQATLYHPHATSLRMSDLGYTNNRTHCSTRVCYDSLESYLQTLGYLINTPHPAYASLDSDNTHEPQQLNSNILQIENEYYSTVRPKQIPQDGESHYAALQSRGIRYVELRSLDINPFHPAGMTQDQLHFLELFMHYCLLKHSPAINQQEAEDINANQHSVACEGRNPKLEIIRGQNMASMRGWALEIMDEMQAIAETLDAAHATSKYCHALTQQLQAVIDPELTPSACVLSDMREHNQSFTEFALRKSIEHHAYYTTMVLSNARFKYYESLCRKSHNQQRRLEANDQTMEMIEKLLLKPSYTQGLCSGG